MKVILKAILCSTLLLGINSAQAGIVDSTREALRYFQTSVPSLGLTAEEQVFLNDMKEINVLLNDEVFDTEGIPGEELIKRLRFLSSEIVAAYNANQLDKFRELKRNFDIDQTITELEEAKNEFENRVKGFGLNLSWNWRGILTEIFGIKTAYAGTVKDILDVIRTYRETITAENLHEVDCRTGLSGKSPGAHLVFECLSNGDCRKRCCKVGEPCFNCQVWQGIVMPSGECCGKYDRNKPEYCICKARGFKGEDCCEFIGGTKKSGACCKGEERLQSDGSWKVEKPCCEKGIWYDQCGCPKGDTPTYDEKYPDNLYCCKGELHHGQYSYYPMRPCCKKPIVTIQGEEKCGCPDGDTLSKDGKACCKASGIIRPITKNETKNKIDIPQCGCPELSGQPKAEQRGEICCYGGKKLVVKSDGSDAEDLVDEPACMTCSENSVICDTETGKCEKVSLITIIK